MPRRPRKPARRRAKQERSREKVRFVLEAAAQVLRSRGYAGATTNHIAEKAGVSVGTVYQYFESKDDIFDMLVKEYFADVVDQVRTVPIDPNVRFETTLRSLVRAGVRAQRHGPELMRALVQVPNTRFRRRVDKGKRDLVAYFRSLLVHYRGELRPIDIDRATVFLMNAAEGVGFNESARNFDDALADELTDLFVRYLSATGTPDRGP